MNWYRSFSGFELLVLSIFIILYLAYIIRMYRIGKILKISYRSLTIKLVLRSAYFILFLIALLGPSFGDTSREVKAIGKDIMICVDLSESMNADEGLRQSRHQRSANAVLTIPVTTQGSDYTTAPEVTIAAPGGGGTQATAVAVLGAGTDAGKVVSITITNPGEGYATNPTVTIGAPPAGR